MGTVLIVDDESSVRFLLRIAFEAAGNEVIEAAHGVAALERARSKRPDLVVTDFMMPVMNGGELVARLRANPETAGIPIVMVTASAVGDTVAADAVLAKPFDPQHVVAIARPLMGGAA